MNYKKKNVLVTGIGQTNYIFQLYSQIAPKLPHLQFSSINLRNIKSPEINKEARAIFNFNYEYYPENLNKIWLLRFLPSIIFNKYFWKDQRILFASKGFNHILNYFSLTFQHLKAKSFASFIDAETYTDVIHLHFPNHKNSLFTEYLEKDYQKIITYWGSDIYRIRDWKDHEIQKKTLSDSQLITCTTQEMRFGLLCRYGFDLFSKIKIVQFLHQDQYYHLADKLLSNQDWKEKFSIRFKIPKDKKVILFGHNAHSENNHIRFLNILSELPMNKKNDFHFVFPMTYGGDQEGHFINTVKERATEININFTIIQDFLDWSTMAKLKIFSEYYIHAPITDGLSAFLLEFFYTNNLAIVADWLPYNTFRNSGLSYAQFSSFTDLKEILLQLDDQKKNFADKISKNRFIIKKDFNLKFMTEKWLSVYKEIS